MWRLDVDSNRALFRQAYYCSYLEVNIKVATYWHCIGWLQQDYYHLHHPNHPKVQVLQILHISARLLFDTII